jgi:hypothetical protein
MRVVIPVLVLVVMVSAEASAQETGWGVKGGINFATLAADADPSPPFEYRIGFVGGGFVTVPLTSHLDLQPEVLFSQQGAGLDETILEPVIKLDSLVTPVLVRYKFSPGGSGFVVFAGPSVGFKLSAKASATTSGTSTTEDIGDEIESVDFGVAFGGGWEAGRFTVDGRYTWGLSSIGKEDSGEEKTTHRVIAVMVGMRF